MRSAGMHPFGEREYIVFTVPAPAYVDICIWRWKYIPSSAGVLPLVGSDRRLKAGCVQISAPNALTSSNSDNFFAPELAFHHQLDAESEHSNHLCQL